LPEVEKEEDLQKVIDQNPQYKEAGLTKDNLLSFFHTQNQIENNPDLKVETISIDPAGF